MLQEGDDGAGAGEVLAGEAGAVLEIGFFGGIDLGGLQEIVHALLAFGGAADEFGVEILADFVDDLEELREGGDWRRASSTDSSVGGASWRARVLPWMVMPSASRATRKARAAKRAGSSTANSSV